MHVPGAVCRMWLGIACRLNKLILTWLVCRSDTDFFEKVTTAPCLSGFFISWFKGNFSGINHGPSKKYCQILGSIQLTTVRTRKGEGVLKGGFFFSVSWKPKMGRCPQ